VKVYESSKKEEDEGSWGHAEIRLKPDTTAKSYETIVLRDVADEDVRVVAELVEVLASR